MADYIVNVSTKFDTSSLKQYEQASKKAGEEAKRAFDKASSAVDKVNKDTKSATGTMNKFGSSLLKVSKFGITAGLGIAAAGMALIVKNTMDAEREMALLTSVIKSTGGAAGYTADQIDKMSNALSRNSTFSSGEINEAASRMLTYTDIVGEEFPRAMQNAIDWATRYGVSVTQAAETIGKAIQKPSAAAGALAQQGFKFTKEFIDQLKQLENTGRLADAQALMFEEIESGVKGAAEAMRNTFGGSIKALKNTFNDLMTGKNGSLDGMTASINTLTDTLNDPSTQQGLIDLANGLIEIANAVVQVVAKIPAFVEWVRWLVTGNADLKNYRQTLEEYTKLAPEVERMTTEYTKMGWSIEKALDYDEEFRNMIARVEELSFAMRGITFNNFNVPVSESALRPPTPKTPKTPTNLPTGRTPESIKAEAAALRERNKIEEQYQRILASFDEPMTKYAQGITDVVAMYQKGQITLDQYVEAVNKINGAEAQENQRILNEELKKQEEHVQQIYERHMTDLNAMEMMDNATRGLEYGTREWHEAQLDVEEALLRTQLALEGVDTAKIDEIATKLRKVSEAAINDNEQRKAIDKITGHLGNAFDAVWARGKEGFKDWLADMGRQLVKSSFLKIMQQLMQNMGNTGGIFGSIFSGLFANGGAFNNGVQYFANGGIVNRPTAFGMAGGLGVMGEAGPEAVMPLKRGPDGKLGVQGGGGVTVNIGQGAVIVNASEDSQDDANKTAMAIRQLIQVEVRKSVTDMQRSGNQLNPAFGSRY